MMKRDYLKIWMGIVGLLILLPLQNGAAEINEKGWKFPNPARATKKAIKPLDLTDRIAGRETLVKIYQKEEGFVYMIFEIDGEVFGCQVHIKGKEGEPQTVYGILDMDGDGSFETKVGRGEKPQPPDWAIERYLEKHGDKPPVTLFPLSGFDVMGPGDSLCRNPDKIAKCCNQRENQKKKAVIFQMGSYFKGKLLSVLMSDQLCQNVGE